MPAAMMRRANMIGSRLAHYDITGHLGSGGMGDVFQATDSKLGRAVALKFLPESFAKDRERVARFEREARVLASLNHPRIAAIYGLEEHGERKFLVMELVEGETLAQMIMLGDPALNSSERTVARWFDTAAFAAPAQFTLGNSPRSMLRGAPLLTTDLTLEKSFRLTESVKLDMRGEFYNLLNHANFNLPELTYGAADFGVISSARPGRTVQLAARLAF